MGIPKDPEKRELWRQRQSESHSGQIPWNTGKHPSIETCKKMRKNHKGFLGRHHRKEVLEKISLSLKGENHFFYGKHHTITTRIKMGKSQLGKKHTEETKEKLRKIGLNRHPSEEVRKRMRESHLGNPGFWTGKFRSEETKQKIRETKKKQWNDPVYLEKMKQARKIKPNKPERFLENILQELFPLEYKYVGDITFVLGGKCPDFMNINGQKKLIELFGTYWHDLKYFPRTESPKERIEHFHQFGFDTLIVWQEELNNRKLLDEKIKNFHYGNCDA